MYLEVGSHLGGMLVPHLLDPLCGAVISIDKRPIVMPDVRGEELIYDQNSTERMIEALRSVPEKLNIEKLFTIDSDVKNVRASEIAASPNLVMVDGEHTIAAVVSDFLSLLRFVKGDTVFLFHDSNIVFDALLVIEKFLNYLEYPHRLVFLYDNVGALLLGGAMQMADELLSRTWDREAFLDTARRYLMGRVADSYMTKSAECKIES
ncbi:class I SAM-dependent methyltransferase [Methylobacterium brachiatum]|uniref:Class I SAM-dependent methyltransferase n=1 Tax=Methylobacterium brachiatum TaxID=269660 RepID=A0ABV1RB21_9HYPH